MAEALLILLVKILAIGFIGGWILFAIDYVGIKEPINKFLKGFTVLAFIIISIYLLLPLL